MATETKPTLESLNLGYTDAERFADHADEILAQIPPALRVQSDGCSEVQAVAAERDAEGRVTRALVWDGTEDLACNPPFRIRTITDAEDAAAVGIVDHGYAAPAPARKFAFYLGNPIVQVAVYEAYSEDEARELAEAEYGSNSFFPSSRLSEVA